MIAVRRTSVHGASQTVECPVDAPPAVMGLPAAGVGAVLFLLVWIGLCPGGVAGGGDFAECDADTDPDSGSDGEGGANEYGDGRAYEDGYANPRTDQDGDEDAGADEHGQARAYGNLDANAAADRHSDTDQHAPAADVHPRPDQATGDEHAFAGNEYARATAADAATGGRVRLLLRGYLELQ